MASFNADGSIQTNDGRTIFADDPVTVDGGAGVVLREMI